MGEEEKEEEEEGDDGEKGSAAETPYYQDFSNAPLEKEHNSQ